MEMNNLEIFYNNMSTFKDTSFDKAAFLRSKNIRERMILESYQIAKRSTI